MNDWAGGGSRTRYRSNEAETTLDRDLNKVGRDVLMRRKIHVGRGVWNSVGEVIKRRVVFPGEVEEDIQGWRRIMSSGVA